MPRRRLEPPVTDRLAVVLRMPSTDPPAAASAQPGGWVPQRPMTTAAGTGSPHLLVGPVVAGPVVARPVAGPRIAPPVVAGPVVAGPAVGGAAVRGAAVPEIGRHRRPARPKPTILTV